MAGYRSQVLQTLHYFGRPQASVRREPLRGPAAWRGAALADDPGWREALDAGDVDELERAVAHARATGKPTASLSRAEFPLPRLTAKIDRWRREIRHGRGFQVISGVPVERWGAEDAGLFFWCFGLHLGIPGAQNPQGDLLGQVRDTGAPPDGSVRQYRTREDIDFHCDTADVVGLLCLSAARSGGQSRIASSVYAYNEVLRRRPALVDRLYRPFWLDTKGEGGTTHVGVVPCAHADGELRTFWHGGYFRSVRRLDPPPAIDADAAALLDLYDELLHAPGTALTMDLAPGDIQLLSNHTIVHGRTGFADDEARRRHLLRLWLSLPERRSLRLRALAAVSRAQVLGRLLAARVRAPARGGVRRTAG
jgi:hypothetical protein